MFAIVEPAVAYLKRSFHGSSSRPLLLTGGKGSGKTSIARLIGDKLQSDRAILAEVAYHDIARLDDEIRLKDLKLKLEEWVETARQRKPCVLVLDNLDSLISPENEVRLPPLSQLSLMV